MTTKTTAKKLKKPLDLPLGKGAPQKEIDLSHVRLPINTSVFGLKQVLTLFETATNEVKAYLAYECDLMYECRVCRTIFRSLANFILHKRKYCRDKYNSSENRPKGCRESDGFSIIQKDIEAANLVISESGDVEEVKFSKRQLNPIIERLLQKQENRKFVEKKKTEDLSKESPCSEKRLRRFDTIALEKINTSDVAVFQTAALHSNLANTEFMKSEVMEIHSILDDSEAIIGSDGKIVSSCDFKKRDKSLAKNILTCTECDLKFSTKKTLAHHVKYRHNDSRLVYPCPECKETLSNPYGVYRHLLRVHRKTTTQIRKYRAQIHNSVMCRKIEGSQPKFKKDTKETKEDKEENDEENEWLDNVEGDNDLQMCGGCGKRFERKAALISHAVMCTKRIAICNSIKENNAKKKDADCRENKFRSKSTKTNKPPIIGSAKRKPENLITYKPKSDTFIRTRRSSNASNENEKPGSLKNVAVKTEFTMQVPDDVITLSSDDECNVQENMSPEETTSFSADGSKNSDQNDEVSEDKVYPGDLPDTINRDERNESNINDGKNEKSSSLHVVFKEEDFSFGTTSKNPQCNSEVENDTGKKDIIPIIAGDDIRSSSPPLTYEKNIMSREEINTPTFIGNNAALENMMPNEERNTPIIRANDDAEQYFSKENIMSDEESNIPSIGENDDIAPIITVNDSSKETIIPDEKSEKTGANDARSPSPLSVTSEENFSSNLSDCSDTPCRGFAREEFTELPHFKYFFQFHSTKKQCEASISKENNEFFQEKSFPETNPEMDLESSRKEETSAEKSSEEDRNDDVETTEVPIPIEDSNESISKPEELESTISLNNNNSKSSVDEDAELCDNDLKNFEHISVKSLIKDIIEEQPFFTITQQVDEPLVEDSIDNISTEASTSVPEIPIENEVEIIPFEKEQDNSIPENTTSNDIKVNGELGMLRNKKEKKRKRSTSFNEELEPKKMFHLQKDSDESFTENEDDSFILRITPYADMTNFLCSLCKSSFTSLSHLLMHMSIHFSWFRYQCSKCSFMSYNKHDCECHVHKEHQLTFCKNIVMPIPTWKSALISDNLNSLEPLVESELKLPNEENLQDFGDVEVKLEPLHNNSNESNSLFIQDQTSNFIDLTIDNEEQEDIGNLDIQEKNPIDPSLEESMNEKCDISATKDSNPKTESVGMSKQAILEIIIGDDRKKQKILENGSTREYARPPRNRIKSIKTSQKDFIYDLNIVRSKTMKGNPSSLSKHLNVSDNKETE